MPFPDKPEGFPVALPLRGRTVRISGDPLPMGLVNASPDCFSDPADAPSRDSWSTRATWPPQAPR
jgi:hypothetical protein